MSERSERASERAERLTLKKCALRLSANAISLQRFLTDLSSSAFPVQCIFIARVASGIAEDPGLHERAPCSLTKTGFFDFSARSDVRSILFRVLKLVLMQFR